jgi:hypothetical protein
MYKIKRASGSAFPCIFSDDFRPTIRKTASALNWNICIMLEFHLVDREHQEYYYQ